MYIETIFENFKNRKTIKQILNSDEAYKILDSSDANNCTFQFGGCWILADALAEYYDSPVFVVYNKTKKIVEHFVIKINNSYVDSDGIQSEMQLINKVSEDGGYNKNELSVTSYNNKMNTEDIVEDKKASKKLAELFKKYTKEKWLNFN